MHIAGEASKCDSLVQQMTSVSILFEISPSDVAVSPFISIHVSDLRSLVLYLAACADPSNLQPLVLVMALSALAFLVGNPEAAGAPRQSVQRVSGI